MKQLQSMLARRHTRLILALLAPGAACWLQSLVWDQIQPRIWFFFYPAVFTSIVLGGLRAGVAATLLSGGLAVWFFMEPRYSLKLSHLPDGLGLLEFLLMGIGVSWWSDRQDRRWALLLQTQRERADYASRFQVLFEQAPVGVALIDSVDGRILELNARFAEIAGRSLAEMRALDWMRITHPDDVQEDLDNMARVGMTVAPVKVAEGERLRHLCMVEDITEIRLQLEALAQAHEQLAQRRVSSGFGSRPRPPGQVFGAGTSPPTASTGRRSVASIWRFRLTQPLVMRIFCPCCIPTTARPPTSWCATPSSSTRTMSPNTASSSPMAVIAGSGPWAAGSSVLPARPPPCWASPWTLPSASRTS